MQLYLGTVPAARPSIDHAGIVGSEALRVVDPQLAMPSLGERSVSLAGLLLALALLIGLTLRGASLFVATPICALIVALTSDMALLPALAANGDSDLISAYMQGFTGFIAAWFFMFLLGAIFGKLMEASGAADSVAEWITGHLGMQRAALAVVAACAVLTYGGDRKSVV